MKVSLMMIIFN